MDRKQHNATPTSKRKKPEIKSGQPSIQAITPAPEKLDQLRDLFLLACW